MRGVQRGSVGVPMLPPRALGSRTATSSVLPFCRASACRRPRRHLEQQRPRAGEVAQDEAAVAEPPVSVPVSPSTRRIVASTRRPVWLAMNRQAVSPLLLLALHDPACRRSTARRRAARCGRGARRGTDRARRAPAAIFARQLPAASVASSVDGVLGKVEDHARSVSRRPGRRDAASPLKNEPRERRRLAAISKRNGTSTPLTITIASHRAGKRPPRRPGRAAPTCHVPTTRGATAIRRQGRHVLFIANSSGVLEDSAEKEKGPESCKAFRASDCEILFVRG